MDTITRQNPETSRTQTNNRFLPVVFFVCGFAGCGLIVLAAHAMVSNAVAGNWPTTDGTVISSRVVIADIGGGGSRGGHGSGSRDVNAAEVRFRYDLNGHHYESEHLSYASNPYPPELAAKYPTGAVVRVYYNPADPSEAVVDMSSSGVHTLLLGIAMLAAYACYLWFARKRRRSA
jgi:Protein of unknown function (DUF3592)